jgi:hypothetical protein
MRQHEFIVREYPTTGERYFDWLATLTQDAMAARKAREAGLKAY